MFTCIQKSTQKEITANDAYELSKGDVNFSDDLIDKVFGVGVGYRLPHFRKSMSVRVRGHFFYRPCSLPLAFPDDLCFDGDYFKLENLNPKRGFSCRESPEHIEGKLTLPRLKARGILISFP